MNRTIQATTLVLIGLTGVFTLTSSLEGLQASVAVQAPPSSLPAVAAPGSGQEPAQEPPDELPPGKICLDCHADLSRQKYVHRPTRRGNCKTCHLQADKKRHRFTPPADMGVVCSECHVLPKRNSLHAPVKDGDCLSCHIVHQSDERYLMRFATEVELCGQCHLSQVGVDKEFVHGPVAAGACSLCHLSHSSTEPRLLRADGETTCLACHVEMTELLAAPNSVHTPVKEGCVQCHDPHSSDHRYQLKNEQALLCADCHGPMIEELRAQPFQHAAMETEQGCAHCHDVHASPLPKMLKHPVGSLCMSCHDQAIERPDGTALVGMGEMLRNSAHLHGPLNEGNCAACHDPHGSFTFSLLRDPYPKSFYAPWEAENYALCFRCHQAAACSTPTTEHLTNFRNGDTNLHFIHVHDKKKGRTCRACHDTHASDRPKHVTEGVPFGTWEIPINFEMTTTGGSCSPGCHSEKKYDRVNPVPPSVESLSPLTAKPPQKQ